MAWAFDNSWVRDLPGSFVEQAPDVPPAPKLACFNAPLEDELGLELGGLDEAALARLLSGAELPQGAQPIAQVYAGHQFGGFSPQLGDGRAILLGEIVAPDGRRFDMQLKGSGRTPYSRGGDGKAALGPMLREFLISEAMHALGIPTTRSLAVVATGEGVWRETPLPGAVLCRIAASHMRVGTFQYFAAQQEVSMLARLADHAMARHYPDRTGAENKGLALLEAVLAAQARLVAQWMSVGFIHGVMNTDNVTISGETIDYGPCAFMDRFARATVFSSIDRDGRYAWGNQPAIMHWNLCRFAEALLPLIDEDGEKAVAMAVERLEAFPALYGQALLDVMRVKLGLSRPKEGDERLVNALFAALEGQMVDYTNFFRALAQEARGQEGSVRGQFLDPGAADVWLADWRARLSSESRDPSAAADAMDRINPLYIARNHLVEEALAAASDNGDLAPFERLLELVQSPFDWRLGARGYDQPAPLDAAPHVTFCGT